MKKNIIEDERMMLRVSDMYYNKNMSQQDIANKLSISRPTISKLLSAAREHGIVTITVSDTNGRKYFQLEQLLEEKYDLKEVFIVETLEDTAETKALMGKAAAQYVMATSSASPWEPRSHRLRRTPTIPTTQILPLSL